MFSLSCPASRCPHNFLGFHLQIPHVQPTKIIPRLVTWPSMRIHIISRLVSWSSMRVHTTLNHENFSNIDFEFLQSRNDLRYVCLLCLLIVDSLLLACDFFFLCFFRLFARSSSEDESSESLGDEFDEALLLEFEDDELESLSSPDVDEESFAFLSFLVLLFSRLLQIFAVSFLLISAEASKTNCSCTAIKLFDAGFSLSMLSVFLFQRIKES